MQKDKTMDKSKDETKKEAAANVHEDVDVNEDVTVPASDESPSPGVAKENENEETSSTVHKTSSPSSTAAAAVVSYTIQGDSRNNFNGKGEASSIAIKDSTSKSACDTSISCKDDGTGGNTHGDTKVEASQTTERSLGQTQTSPASDEPSVALPEPFPPSTPNPHHQVSSPGAHRVQGREVSRMAPAGPLTTVNYAAPSLDGDNLEEGLSILHNANQSNLGDLSIARPVQEMTVSPHAAQPVAHQGDLLRPFSGGPNHDGNNSKRRFYHLAVSIAALVAIVVAISITSVLLVQDSSSSKNTSDDSNIPNSLNSSTSSQDDDGVLEQSRLLGMPLPEYTLETIRNDKSGSSPQSRGLAWILDDPNLFNYTLWQKHQRFALAILYFATNGDEWHLHPNWLQYNTSECFWETRLPLETYDDPNNLDTAMAAQTSRSCDEEGYYRTLDLTKNNLVGSIPPEIELLAPTLTTLNIKDNPLSSGSGSTLPEEIFSLTNLKSLVVSFCELTGTIPSKLGVLTQLTLLVMGQNKFKGTIPREIAYLSNMRGLFMNYLGPSVTGTLPLFDWFGGIDTTNNQTGGFSFLSDLRTLHVHGNKGLDRNNTLPTEIGNIGGLEKVLFGQVSFVGGTIPSEIGLLTNMTVFNMRNSSVTGSLPIELWNLTSMQKLELDGNDLSGPGCPSEIGQMTDLKELFLSANPSLAGTLSSELALLTSLKNFFLHDTGISGSIPGELHVLSNLQTLTLSDTKLQGRIPQFMCNKIVHPGSVCKPTKVGPANPDLHGTCYSNQTDLLLCAQTLLCGCDCGACGSEP